MSNYTDTIQHAKNLLSAILRDENQGHLTFLGNGNLTDLDISHPCDLSQLRAGTVLAVNGEEWMLIENCDAARKWNTYWMSCDGVAMTSMFMPSSTPTHSSTVTRQSDIPGGQSRKNQVRR